MTVGADDATCQVQTEPDSAYTMVCRPVIASGRLLADPKPAPRGHAYIFRVSDVIALSFVTQQVEELIFLYWSAKGRAEILKGHGRLVLKNAFLAISAVSRPKAKAVPCIELVPDLMATLSCAPGLQPNSALEFSTTLNS